MSAGPTINWQNDLAFQNLPLQEKHKALLAIDPAYKGLPPQEQVKALTTIHYGQNAVPAEDTSSQNPAMRALSSFGNTLKQAPEALYNTARHPLDTLEGVRNDVNTSMDAWANPKTRPTWEGVKSVLPEALGIGAGNVAAGEVTGKALGGLSDAAGGAANAAGSAVEGVKSGIKTVGQEVMNEGPSKLRVLEDQHAHATAAQKHIADVASKVHDDAQAAMGQVASKVDATNPQGTFDKMDVGNRVKGAIGDTVSDTNQLPKSVRDLVPSDDLQAKRSTGPSVGGRHFDLSNPSDLKAYQRLKEQGAFTEAEIGRMEGTTGGDAHSFSELQQIRSNVGKQMQGLEGAPKAASNAVYGELSKMLREGARDAGVEPDWIDANARWKGYLDDFQRSPLKKTLDGDNAHDIMGPLASDSTRVEVGNILSKYKPFGMDMETLNQEIGRYNHANKVNRLSEPNSRTVLLAAISPKIAAIKTAMSRTMRNPERTSNLMGKGFDAPTIKPKQVYPTKEAAAAALKGKD